jgi:hypothetical protein
VTTTNIVKIKTTRVEDMKLTGTLKTNEGDITLEQSNLKISKVRSIPHIFFIKN